MFLGDFPVSMILQNVIDAGQPPLFLFLFVITISLMLDEGLPILIFQLFSYQLGMIEGNYPTSDL